MIKSWETATGGDPPLKCGAIHGALPKTDLDRQLKQYLLPFRHPDALNCIDGTSILAFGLNLPGVKLMITAGAERNVSDISQTMGRCREEGTALFVVPMETKGDAKRILDPKAGHSESWKKSPRAEQER